MKRKIFYLLVLLSLLFLPFAKINAAEKIKINKTKLSLNINGTFLLKLNSTSKSITWKSSNKKIATVSKYGVVKAIKEGTTTITATVGKNQYSCKVTVLPKPLTDEEKISNITYSTYATNSGLMVKMKNNNTVRISALQVDISFYDEANKLIYLTNKQYFYQLDSNKEFVATFDYPKENIEPYNYIKYDHYTVRIEPMGVINYKSDVSKKINIEEEIVDFTNYFTVANELENKTYRNISEDFYKELLRRSGEESVVTEQRKKFNLIVTNNSNEIISNLNIFVLYYKDNEISMFDEYRDFNVNVGKTKLERGFSYLEDQYGYRTTFENNELYDRYEIFVNYAYVSY